MADTKLKHTAPLPSIPDSVIFELGDFVNSDSIRLTSYSFTPKDQDIVGVVYLAHGYAGHSQFEWFHPPNPGSFHQVYEGSIVDKLVQRGFAVRALDHRGHGRSDSELNLRCYFHSFDCVVMEIMDYIRTVVRKEPGCETVPLFAWGVSMGGATVVQMARKFPDMISGIILYAPMLSLDKVRRQRICCCIENRHIEPFADSIGACFPTLPIATPARNTHNPLAQQEMDDDPLTYSGNVRARIAVEFLHVTTEFLGGGLRELTTPLITFHSAKDSFTDPYGSERLVADARSQDKTYVRIGAGLDIDVDMWHALASEPGHELLSDRAIEWINSHLSLPVSPTN